MRKGVRVRELAEQLRGVSYGKSDASSTPRPGYLPVLRAGNITEDGLTFDDLVFVQADRISANQKIRRNDGRNCRFEREPRCCRQGGSILGRL